MKCPVDQLPCSDPHCQSGCDRRRRMPPAAAPLIEGSLKQWTALYMMERRLTIDEALAVVKLLEDDAKLAYLHGRWHLPAAGFAEAVRESLIVLVRGKVIAWMDKYRERHSARCLFTGDS